MRYDADLKFDSEFYSASRHRVEIEVRDGFPCQYHRTMCDRLAEYLGNNGLSSCQIIRLFDDDTHGVISVAIGTDDQDEASDCKAEDFLTMFYAHGGFSVEVAVLPKGNKNSDHYNHAAWMRTAYLKAEESA